MGNVVVVLEVGWNLKVSAGGDYETLENVLKVGKLKRVWSAILQNIKE